MTKYLTKVPKLIKKISFVKISHKIVLQMGKNEKKVCIFKLLFRTCKYLYIEKKNNDLLKTN